MFLWFHFLESLCLREEIIWARVGHIYRQCEQYDRKTLVQTIVVQQKTANSSKRQVSKSKIN